MFHSFKNFGEVTYYVKKNFILVINVCSRFNVRLQIEIALILDSQFASEFHAAGAEVTQRTRRKFFRCGPLVLIQNSIPFIRSYINLGIKFGKRAGMLN
jgi:hypothetical protein